MFVLRPDKESSLFTHFFHSLYKKLINFSSFLNKVYQNLYWLYCKHRVDIFTFYKTAQQTGVGQDCNLSKSSKRLIYTILNILKLSF